MANFKPGNDPRSCHVDQFTLDTNNNRHHQHQIYIQDNPSVQSVIINRVLLTKNQSIPNHFRVNFLLPNNLVASLLDRMSFIMMIFVIK